MSSPKAAPEPGRYHLIAAYSDPAAHQAILMRQLKNLQEAVPLSVMHPVPDAKAGFRVAEQPDPHFPEYSAAPDIASSADLDLHQALPMLLDAQERSLISSDGLAIMSKLNEWGRGTAAATDYEPADLQADIARQCRSIQDGVVANIRRCGSATSQEEYETACKALFAALDQLNEQLSSRRYLISRQQDGLVVPTLADWLLFTHLVRFDAVENVLFKANLRRIRDYTHLQALCTRSSGLFLAWLGDLYSRPGVADTVKWPHILAGGWLSRPDLNPKLRVPLDGVPFLPAPPLARRRLDAADASEPQQPPGGGQPQAKVGGEFVRPDSKLRSQVTADGGGEFPAEAGRYHLYIANNCPWCHRVALARAVLGLEDAVSTDVLFYRRDPDRGWQFKPEEEGCTPDTAAGGIRFIRELYERQGSQEKSVCSSGGMAKGLRIATQVPVLFDKKTQRIVNNESADILRIFATGFKAFQRAGAPNLLPLALLPRIDDINAWVYADINNGAYRAGFASEQGAYNVAFSQFFAALDRVESILQHTRFLCGDEVTEADVRLFPTLFRFDHVYYNRFLLNLANIHDSFPAVQRWLEDMWAVPGVAAASNLDHCKRGYFGRTGNNIVPLGPLLAWP